MLAMQEHGVEKLVSDTLYYVSQFMQQNNISLVQMADSVVMQCQNSGRNYLLPQFNVPMIAVASSQISCVSLQPGLLDMQRYSQNSHFEDYTPHSEDHTVFCSSGENFDHRFEFEQNSNNNLDPQQLFKDGVFNEHLTKFQDPVNKLLLQPLTSAALFKLGSQPCPRLQRDRVLMDQRAEAIELQWRNETTPRSDFGDLIVITNFIIHSDLSNLPSEDCTSIPHVSLWPQSRNEIKLKCKTPKFHLTTQLRASFYVHVQLFKKEGKQVEFLDELTSSSFDLVSHSKMCKVTKRRVNRRKLLKNLDNDELSSSLDI